MEYPVGTHPGILILHFPNETSTTDLNAHLTAALETLTGEDLRKALTIVGPGRIRSRTPEVP